MLCVFVFLHLCGRVEAQFFSDVNDPASLRWNSMRTSSFRMIYPRGCDSLATVYLRELERFRPLVATSLQMASGQYQTRPLDVLMHTRNAASNGSVTWTPSRMQVFTVPQWNSPEALPWPAMLAVHEGRHAAQMQMGYKHVFRPFYYILGQIVPGAAAIYPGSLLLEGDAVVAETALTTSGRGRTADFLDYYMYSFDHGEYRNWAKWSNGSYYRYAPNHYAFGYFVLSGARTLYDAPLFMADFFDYVSRRPYDPWPLRHNLRRYSGKKFKAGIREIEDFHYKLWCGEAEKRAPFAETSVLSPSTRRMTSYGNSTAADEGFLWVKSDLYHNPSIVCLDSTGIERRIAGISSSIGVINSSSDGNLLCWNELRNDSRWGQVWRSVVRYMDRKTLKRGTLSLPKGTYVCPTWFSGDTLAVISYIESGGSEIILADRNSSSVCGRISVPSNVQPVEITACGETLWMTAISEGGYGMWRRTPEGEWTAILEPQPVKMASLGTSGEDIVFDCDLNGSREMYRYCPASGKLYRVTGSRYGGRDYAMDDEGNVQFAGYHGRGQAVMSVGSESVLNVETQWKDVHVYPVAEKLAKQERNLPRSSASAMKKYHFARRGTRPVPTVPEDSCGTMMPDNVISPVSRYVKSAHSFRFHSWAPAYVDIDAVRTLSFDSFRNIASLGLMGFFQNTMSTVSGYIGYKAAPDSGGRWNHSGHVNLTYSGLYPVFELQAHVGEGKARDYWLHETGDTLFTRLSSRPYVRASLKTYIPWSWKVDNANFGLIPSAALHYNNTVFEGRHTFLFNVGLRGYVVSSTPSACVYPRWGIGAEYQWNDPLQLFYIYAYTPGICCGQGLRLSYVDQSYTRSGYSFLSAYANVLPRGFVKYGEGIYRGRKFTADYAIPFYMGDWNISDAFYCSRGIITPHFDLSYIPDISEKYKGKNSLYSVGATFEMEFGCFFWVKTPVRAGVTYSYNGGSLFPYMEMKSPHYVGATFSIDILNQ